MLNNYMISVIRTGVPVLVGLLLTWLATSLKIVVDPHTEAALAGTSVAVVSALYYALVRALEHKWPQLGWLLGSPNKPTYTNS